jgi:hypothetical protein
VARTIDVRRVELGHGELNRPRNREEFRSRRLAM